MTLSEINPPDSYTITGQGQGGTVGSAKGGAKVRLAEAGGATVLSYDVDAEVGGRLAQLGGPIIDATAKQLAAKFFRQFGEVVEGTRRGCRRRSSRRQRQSPQRRLPAALPAVRARRRPDSGRACAVGLDRGGRAGAARRLLSRRVSRSARLGC